MSGTLSCCHECKDRWVDAISKTRCHDTCSKYQSAKICHDTKQDMCKAQKYRDSSSLSLLLEGKLKETKRRR